jgi:DNA-binding MarR family transcriptional regulator
LNQNDIDLQLLALLSLSLNIQGINKALEAKYGLSIVQWALLRHLLEMPAVSPLVLARTLQVTPGTLSQTLTRLSRKGYVFVCGDPRDARRKMISITRRGRDALEDFQDVYASAFSEISHLAGELRLLNDFLTAKVRSRLTSGNNSPPDSFPGATRRRTSGSRPPQ